MDEVKYPEIEEMGGSVVKVDGDGTVTP